MGFRKSPFLRHFAKFFAVLTVSAAAMSSAGCAATGQTPGPANPGGLTMDEALVAAAANMMASIAPGTKVAVLNYTSSSECLSEYAVGELEANIVETGKVTVVDRKELDLIRREMDFQYSSEVRNESAQDLGRKLGAQVIITGTHTELAGTHRILIRALVVESAVVAAQYRNTVVADAVVTALVKNCDKSPAAAAQVTQVAQAGGGAVPAADVPAAATAAAAPAKPAQVLQNGIYTLNPRPRVRQAGGTWEDMWLTKVEVETKFITFYFDNRATGAGKGYGNSYLTDWGVNNVTLYNLDKPNVFVKSTGVTEGSSSMTVAAIIFPRIDSKRFKMETVAFGRDKGFEEIILGEPDQD